MKIAKLTKMYSKIYRDMPGCPFWKEKFPRERLKEIFADRASNILEFIEEDLLF